MTLLWPVYEFRPMPGMLIDGMRYAEGRWIKDDGEYDLAFSGLDPQRFPMALGVNLPYRPNILWSWLSVKGNWGKFEPKHPRGNAWHYLLRPGAREWGDSWSRDAHPNLVAYESAMKHTTPRYGCANGSGPDFNPDDQYIQAGLLRERESGVVVVPPVPLGCVYCDKTWPRAVKG